MNKKVGKELIRDFPTAWDIMRQTKLENHHEDCSYRSTKGSLLCDCAAMAVFILTVPPPKIERGKCKCKETHYQIWKMGGHLGDCPQAKSTSPKLAACSCHCHLGGHYQNCKSHSILSCSHCTPKTVPELPKKLEFPRVIKYGNKDSNLPELILDLIEKTNEILIYLESWRK